MKQKLKDKRKEAREGGGKADRKQSMETALFEIEDPLVFETVQKAIKTKNPSSLLKNAVPQAGEMSEEEEAPPL